MNSTNTQVPDMGYLGMVNTTNVLYQLSPAQLIEAAICRDEGVLTESGALAIDTGEFTGRSPKDRFIVADEITENSVWWGDINIRFEAIKFDALYKKVVTYLAEKEIFVRDSCACANEKYHVDIRVVTETAYQNLFVHHLFLRPEVPNPINRPELPRPALWPTQMRTERGSATFLLSTLVKR